MEIPVRVYGDPPAPILEASYVADAKADATAGGSRSGGSCSSGIIARSSDGSRIAVASVHVPDAQGASLMLRLSTLSICTRVLETKSIWAPESLTASGRDAVQDVPLHRYDPIKQVAAVVGVRWQGTRSVTVLMSTGHVFLFRVSSGHSANPPVISLCGGGALDVAGEEWGFDGAESVTLIALDRRRRDAANATSVPGTGDDVPAAVVAVRCDLNGVCSSEDEDDDGMESGQQRYALGSNEVDRKSILPGKVEHIATVLQSIRDTSTIMHFATFSHGSVSIYEWTSYDADPILLRTFLTGPQWRTLGLVLSAATATTTQAHKGGEVQQGRTLLCVFGFDFGSGAKNKEVEGGPHSLTREGREEEETEFVEREELFTLRLPTSTSSPHSNQAATLGDDPVVLRVAPPPPQSRPFLLSVVETTEDAVDDNDRSTCGSEDSHPHALNCVADPDTETSRPTWNDVVERRLAGDAGEGRAVFTLPSAPSNAHPFILLPVNHRSTASHSRLSVIAFDVVVSPTAQPASRVRSQIRSIHAVRASDALHDAVCGELDAPIRILPRCDASYKHHVSGEVEVRCVVTLMDHRRQLPLVLHFRSSAEETTYVPRSAVNGELSTLSNTRSNAPQETHHHHHHDGEIGVLLGSCVKCIEGSVASYYELRGNVHSMHSESGGTGQPASQPVEKASPHPLREPTRYCVDTFVFRCVRIGSDLPTASNPLSAETYTTQRTTDTIPAPSPSEDIRPSAEDLMSMMDRIVRRAIASEVGEKLASIELRLAKCETAIARVANLLTHRP